MILVRVSPDLTLPSWGARLERREWARGMRASDLVPEGWDPTRTVLVHRGRRVGLDAEVADGSAWNVCFAPAGIDPVSILVNVLISVALSYTASLLIGKPKLRKDQRGRGETVYGFAGIQNSYVNGASVPVVYGLHRVGGVGLALFSRVENDEDKVFILLGLCEGQIQGIGEYTSNQTNLTGGALPEGLLINGNPAEGFRDVQVSLRMGTGSQSAIPAFADAATSFLISSELPLIAGRLAQASAIGAEFGILQEDAGLFSVNDVITISWNSVSEEDHTITARNPTTQRVNWTGQPNNFLHNANDFVRKFEALTAAPGVEADAWDLNFLFPSGLFQVNASGAQEPNYVHVQYRYRIAGDAWPAWNGSQRWEFEGDFIGARRMTVRLEFGSREEWEVQMRRVTPRNFQEEQYSREIWIDTINTILDDAFEYPFTALLGLRALASNQLSGSTPVVTALVKGRLVGIWNEDTPATFAATWSRNPAWIALDILRNARYGAGGHTDDDASYNLERWLAWAAYCDEQIRDGSGIESTVLTAAGVGVGKIYLASTAGFAVDDVITINPETPTADTRTITFKGTDGGGAYVLLDVNTFYAHAVDEPVVRSHERHLCDVVFDSPTDIWQAVQQVASCGRASIMKVGSRIYPFWDRPQDPVQLFSSANIIAGSFKWAKRSLEKAPNTMEVSFLNAEIDYDQDKDRVVTPEAEALVEPTVVETISLYGITRRVHAHREAMYHLKVLLQRHTTVEFKVGLDALASEPGDVILVEHPSLHQGRGCRVAAGSGASDVVLDHEVTIESGKAYIVRVHHKDTDTLESIEVSMAPGVYPAGTAITLASAWANAPLLGAVAVFGEITVETSAYLIQRVSTAQDLSRLIVAQNYDPDVYAPYEEVQVSSLVYGNGTGSAMAQLVEGDDVFPPAVTDVAVAERVRESPSGEPVIELHLSWDFTRDVDGDDQPRAIGHGTRFHVFLRTAGSSTDDDPNAPRTAARWRQVGTTAERHLILERGFAVGVEYEFAVVAESRRGGFANVNDATVAAYTPLGIAGGAVEWNPSLWSGPDLPDTPTGVLVPIGETGAVTLVVAQGAASRVVPNPHFEARLGGWVLGTRVGTGDGPHLRLDGIPADGESLIHVRETRQSGLVSGEPLILENPRTTPVAYASQLGTSEYPSFPGTKTQMAVHAVPVGTPARLSLSGSNLTGSYATATKDAGVVDLALNRVTWIEVDAEHLDEDLTWADADFAWNSRAAKCRTWEGDLYDPAPATMRIYYATSDDGSAWSDWTEYHGATIHEQKRYWKAKAEFARPDTTKQVLLADLRIITVEKT